MEITREGYVILAGEFNVTLTSREKRGESIIRDPFREACEDTINGGDLMDIPPKKGIFTWTNKRQGNDNITTRLDRFLVQSDLMIEAIELNSHIIANGTYDHKPITLEIKEVENYGPIPFRFNSLWLQYPEAMSIIHRQWGNYINGSPSYVFKSKLKMVKLKLKRWDKNHYTKPESER